MGIQYRVLGYRFATTGECEYQGSLTTTDVDTNDRVRSWAEALGWTLGERWLIHVSRDKSIFAPSIHEVQ